MPQDLVVLDAKDVDPVRNDPRVRAVVKCPIVSCT